MHSKILQNRFPGELLPVAAIFQIKRRVHSLDARINGESRQGKEKTQEMCGFVEVKQANTRSTRGYFQICLLKAKF